MLGPGRQVERVPAECEPGPPVGSRRERPCVSSLAPGRQARSRLHSVRQDSSWHQLQSGTMPGFLSFFLPSRFYNDDNAVGIEAHGGETSYIADPPELSEEAFQQVAVDVA